MDKYLTFRKSEKLLMNFKKIIFTDNISEKSSNDENGLFLFN